MSGVAKASDFSAPADGNRLRGSRRASLPVALLLLVTELAIAVALLPSSTAHLGGVAAAAWLVVCIAATALAISLGRPSECHRFRIATVPLLAAHRPAGRVPFPGVVDCYRRLGGERGQSHYGVGRRARLPWLAWV